MEVIYVGGTGGLVVRARRKNVKSWWDLEKDVPSNQRQMNMGQGGVGLP